MDGNSKFKNSEELIKYLQDPAHNKEVEGWIRDWEAFTKTHEETRGMNRTQFTQWAKDNNIELAGKDIFVGNEALRALPSLKSKDIRTIEEPHQTTSAKKHLSDAASAGKGALYTPFLIASSQKQIIEEDRQYRKTRREVAKEWRKEHDVKTFYDSKEALDFHAGVGEDTLHQRTMDRLKEKMEKKKSGSFQKKVDFYNKREEKVKKFVGDARTLHIQSTLQDYQHGLSSLVEKKVKESKLKDKEAKELRTKLFAENKAPYEKLQNKLWGDFIAKNPKKVSAYKITLDKVNETNPYIESPSKTAKKMEENFKPEEKPKKPSVVEKITKKKPQEQDLSELRRMVLAARARMPHQDRNTGGGGGGFIAEGGGPTPRFSPGGIANNAVSLANRAMRLARAAQRVIQAAQAIAAGVSGFIAGLPVWIAGAIVGILLLFIFVFLTGFTSAQYNNPPPTPTPTPGGGGGGGSGSVLSYANALEAAIVSACFWNAVPQYGNVGVVTGANVGCLNGINWFGTDAQPPHTPGPLPGTTGNNNAALGELQQSAGVYCSGPTTSLQCVGFARAVAAGVGAPLNPPAGNADQYTHSFPPHWQWIAKGQPQPGDIAVFTGFNHIGVIYRAATGSGPFALDEANGCGGVLPPGSVDRSGQWYQQDGNWAGVLRYTP